MISLHLGQIADTTNVAIQKMFKKDSAVELQLKKIYNFRTTEDYIEKDSSLSGLSEAEFTIWDTGKMLSRRSKFNMLVF